MKLHDIPYTKLDPLNTPFYKLDRFSQAAGGPQIYIKRDDMTELGLGGNKTRKLEYLLTEAQEQGAKVLITTGGVQSNHARLTAAVAKKLGMECAVILKGVDPPVHKGNLLLMDILDTEIHYLHPDVYFDVIAEEMEALAAAKAAQGKPAYIIPVGGATPLGSCGYVRFMEELARQTQESGVKLDTIVISLGACGTMAGILAGAELFMPGVRVIGVSVSGTREVAGAKVAELANGVCEMLDMDKRFALEDLEIYDQYVGEAYAVPSPAAVEAIYLMARTEGILCDPVYTGKGLSGMLDLIKQGVISKDEKVMFLHTGGAPALFAYEEYFAK